MRTPNANAATARFRRPLPPTFHVILCAALLAGVGLGDFLLLNQQRDMGMIGGMRGEPIGETIMWLLACRLLPIATTCAGAVILWRIMRSALRQHAQTQVVLRPLLAQSPLTPPARLQSLLQCLQLERRTRLIACEFPVALCYGLLHPRLLFSTAAVGQLSPLELEAVIRHEQVHLRRRDPLRRLLLRAFADALPLRTLQHLAENLPLAQELAADRIVLATVGPEGLSGALLKVGDALGTLEQAPAGLRNPRQPLAVGAFGSIDARIDQILGAPILGQPRAASGVLPVVVLALLASGPLLCLLLPFPAPLFWGGSVALVGGWPRLCMLPGLLACLMRQKIARHPRAMEHHPQSKAGGGWHGS